MPERFEPVNFLIVDDDNVSVMAIRRSLKKLNIVNEVHTASDGLQALEILHKALDGNQFLPPFIVTLDLNMPRMTGLEFLDEIRQHPNFRKLVVFVLTTSDAPADIDSAYDKNIAGYIVKDNPTESLLNAIVMLKDFSQLVVLPN